MTSISYQFPKIYNIFLCFFEKNTEKKYKLIAKLVGNNKKVFELGCGTALLSDWLDKSCSYIGWDLNNKFINYCHNKGLNVFKKDIFDFDEYPKNDVIVISNVLHHVAHKDKTLIYQARRKTKMLIITEPIKGLSYQKIPSILYWFYDKIFGDNDGINSLKDRKKWGFDNREDVEKYFNTLNAKKIIFLKKSEKFIAIF